MAAIAKRRRTVIVVVDGLRQDLVTPRLTPRICSLAEQGTTFTEYHSIFPSATRITAATLATGCLPASHGLFGNTMALADNGRLLYRSAFNREFISWMRTAFGRTLRRPTLSERFASAGGAIVYSNMPAGDALFHDPDGYGHVYSLTVSVGPGGREVPASEALTVTQDTAGDEAMTRRFCREVLFERAPAYALMWLCEPDTHQHHHEFGTPEHEAVIRASDARVGEVFETIRRLDDEVLFIVCADHGQETVMRRVPVTAQLVAAGLKQSPESDEVVVCPNGSSLMIYMRRRDGRLLAELAEFFARQDWVRQVYAGGALAQVGYVEEAGLVMAVDLAHIDQPNRWGIRGQCVIAEEDEKNQPATADGGFGTHGGLGSWEMQPFLVVNGPGFPAGLRSAQTVSPCDLAPTVLRHHGIKHEQLDGVPLQCRLGIPAAYRPDNQEEK